LVGGQSLSIGGCWPGYTPPSGCSKRILAPPAPLCDSYDAEGLTADERVENIVAQFQTMPLVAQRQLLKRQVAAGQLLPGPAHADRGGCERKRTGSKGAEKEGGWLALFLPRPPIAGPGHPAERVRNQIAITNTNMATVRQLREP